MNPKPALDLGDGDYAPCPLAVIATGPSNNEVAWNG